jgi:hypothetical protein
MNLGNDKQQKNTQGTLDFHSEPTGEARQAGGEATESVLAVQAPENPASTTRLMEEVGERENLKEALRRVKGNKGSPGIDGMTVEELPGHLQQHWLEIREQLLNGTYQPLVNQELLVQNEYLAAENRILKARLPRLRLCDGERQLWRRSESGSAARRWKKVACIAKPDTILGWYRKLIADKFDSTMKRRSPGRPRISPETEHLVLRSARENSGWIAEL